MTATTPATRSGWSTDVPCNATFDAGTPEMLAAWRRELLKSARRDFFDAGVLSLAHETRGQHPLPHVLKWNLAMIMSLNAGRSEHEGSMSGCSGACR